MEGRIIGVHRWDAVHLSRDLMEAGTERSRSHYVFCQKAVMNIQASFIHFFFIQPRTTAYVMVPPIVKVALPILINLFQIAPLQPLPEACLLADPRFLQLTVNVNDCRQRISLSEHINSRKLSPFGDHISFRDFSFSKGERNVDWKKTAGNIDNSLYLRYHIQSIYERDPQY